MRRLVTVSAVAAAAALVGACGGTASPTPGTGGDAGAAGSSSGSSGAAGTAGAGGSSGAAGAAGAGGSAGTAGAGGSSGTAGSGGTAGASGSPNQPDAGDAGVDGGDAGTGDAGDAAAPPPCIGCVELRVPFTAANDVAFFQFAFSAVDLHDTVVSFRLRAPLLDETGQLYLQPFATDDSGFTLGQGTFTLIDAATFGDTESFVDISLDVAAITTTGFDNTHVVALGIQVGAGGSFVGPATPVLLLDSVTHTGSGTLTNLDFTDDAQGVAVNAFAGLQTAEVIHH